MLMQGSFSCIKHIKRFLDAKTLEIVIHAFVTSKIDYCNSLLLGIPQTQLRRLQKVQNAAARILTGTRMSEHITPTLHRLHWLPVEQRIKFKVLLLLQKSLYADGPSYLTENLERVDAGSHVTRSVGREEGTLRVAFTRSSTVFNRSFSIAGARLWNGLPVEIRNLSDTSAFKKLLKTFLFREFYSQRI
jgi:hypothetical protein